MKHFYYMVLLAWNIGICIECRFIELTHKNIRDVAQQLGLKILNPADIITIITTHQSFLPKEYNNFKKTPVSISLQDEAARQTTFLELYDNALKNSFECDKLSAYQATNCYLVIKLIVEITRQNPLLLAYI